MGVPVCACARASASVCVQSDAEQLFANNPFKLAMIRSKLPDGCVTTAYRCGPFVDLCRGPHLPNTGYAAHARTRVMNTRAAA
eukprot:94699-Pleurochrysis_carterae.AAC.1